VLDIGRQVEVRGVGGGLPEGNVVVEALDNRGRVLAQQATIIDAPDAGTGGQGPWAARLSIDVDLGTTGQIRAFSPSPADNSILAETRVDVTYGTPAEDVPPTAVIEGPAEAFVGDEVTFQGGNSAPGSSAITVYSWNFGNTRSFNDSPDVSATTTYDAPGQYDVSLTVTDQNDLSDTASMKITIKDVPVDIEPPVAVINGPGQATVGESVSFDGSASQPGNGGKVVRYDWDLGDGQQASGPVINHVYDNAGSYRVTLFVTDEDGQSGSSQIDIDVSDAPSGGGSIEGTWLLAGTPDGIDIMAQFNAGALSGSAGCNTYNGSYTLSGTDQLSVGPLSTSQQLCDDATMAAEQAYLQAIQSATTYQVNDDQLTINTATGALNFVNAVSPF
jgi:PKD repeat protein